MEFRLKFSGENASDGELEFYDAARSILGFERSLALTAHFILNGEIITQAPALKGAKILVRPPREGSWEIVASIVGGLVAGGALSKDSVFGHLMWSAYDYVVSQTLGFHVEFDKSLVRSHRDFLEGRKKDPDLAVSEGRLDSLIEKTESALIEMHRPMVWSGTAAQAVILDASSNEVGIPFTSETYEFAANYERESKALEIVGIVSSYNVNTYRGRIFVSDEERAVPFELSESARTLDQINKIVNSLRSNAIERRAMKIAIDFSAFRDTTSTGRLKGYYVGRVH